MRHALTNLQERCVDRGSSEDRSTQRFLLHGRKRKALYGSPPDTHLVAVPAEL